MLVTCHTCHLSHWVWLMFADGEREGGYINYIKGFTFLSS